MNSKNKVLMITPDYPPDVFGGIGIHVNELAIALSEINCDLTVVVAPLYKEMSFSRIEINDNLSVVTLKQQITDEVPLNYWPLRLSKYNEQLLNELDKYIEHSNHSSFDIIHIHDYYHAHVAVALKEKFQLPLISTIHSIAPPASHFIDGLRRFLASNSDTIISVSAWLREKIKTRYNLDDSVKVIHNGITCKNPDAALLRAKKPTQPKIITFVGRLAPRKGCDILLRAFKKVLINDPTVILQMIGDGPLRSNLESLADDLGILDNVQFLGYIKNEEIRSYLANSSLHVVPSTQEPFGIVALEAMAEGIPVITTTVGGFPEFITHGWNGYMVEPDEVNSLSDAIQLLIENTNLRSNLAYNALTSLNNFSWKKVAASTKSIYLEHISKEKIIKKYHINMF
ncbi:glycosyltransferase family 4 protein [Paenibacillus sp. 32O-W]|uniref:glycosyltransferase family 4 protein n=1 Tax=Paenibacillus sp. 32O-W TaxID=1695218 RepID=UPI0011A92DE2|nr:MULTISPECIES: glycosyltransferase family 4 protein [Paenibacillaceae]